MRILIARFKDDLGGFQIYLNITQTTIEIGNSAHFLRHSPLFLNDLVALNWYSHCCHKLQTFNSFPSEEKWLNKAVNEWHYSNNDERY